MELAKLTFRRVRVGDEVVSASGEAPCVLRSSLQCGEKCSPVMGAPSSSLPGTVALECAEDALTVHSWIVP